MIATFKEKFIDFIKRSKFNLAANFIMVLAVPLVINNKYMFAEDKSPAFYLLSLNGLLLYGHILYRTIKPNFTQSDLKRMDGVVPLLYILMFLLLIFYFTGQWYALGGYGGTACYGDSACDLQEALYFSVSTSTTLGYGDLKPTSDAARIFACTQVITSLLHGVVGFAFLMRNIVTSGTITDIYYHELDVANSLPRSNTLRVPVEQWPEMADNLRNTSKCFVYSLERGRPGTWINL